MYYHSNIEKQLIEIFKNVDMDKYKLKCNENELSDITDGRIYRKLLMSEDGDLFRNLMKKNEDVLSNANDNSHYFCLNDSMFNNQKIPVMSNSSIIITKNQSNSSNINAFNYISQSDNILNDLMLDDDITREAPTF